MYGYALQPDQTAQGKKWLTIPARGRRYGVART
jgi:hypothetical protein